jgi:hypothetical protein
MNEMPITSSGPICDVCDKYIFIGDINQFTVNGLYKSLMCCDLCKDKVLEMSRLKDWRVLPEGGLRRFYAQMEKEGKINHDPVKEAKSESVETEGKQ